MLHLCIIESFLDTHIPLQKGLIIQPLASRRAIVYIPSQCLDIAAGYYDSNSKRHRRADEIADESFTKTICRAAEKSDGLHVYIGAQFVPPNFSWERED